MKRKNHIQLTVTFFMVLAIMACSPEAPQDSKEKPIVNDENCKPGNITNIKDKSVREAFADACFRRGDFKPSTGKTW